ncbi:MAG: PQQ-like beta-propeller repeat protein [Syntrophomonadaceae bacterium]|nr:PQQ-like beta-propeller repeat protein [Syntrophomonadaceae bacterium]
MKKGLSYFLILVMLIFSLLSLACKDERELVQDNKETKTSEVKKDSQEKNSLAEKAADLFYFRTYREAKPFQNEYYVDVILEAFDKQGNQIWEYVWPDNRLIEYDVASEAIAYDGKVYIEVSGILYCLDGKSGKKLWENQDDARGRVVLYPYNDRIYLTSFYGNIISCLDKDSGTKIWANDDEDMFWGHTIYSQGDEIVVKYGEDGLSTVAFDKNGQIKDKRYESFMPDNLIRWDRAFASSFLVENIAKHEAKNVLDQRGDTAWVEAVEGHGINEWIKIERKGLVDVNKIEILNGYHKSKGLYDKNSKLKEFRLDFSRGEYIYHKIDDSKYPVIHIELFFDRPVPTDSIKLTIVDVFEGDSYEDTCITEINAYKD